MILGERSCFTREHFEAHKGFAPSELCELVVYSLELVSQLAQRGLAFRFKGGNSQLVLLDDPRRFSIDADICGALDKAALIAEVEAIAAECELFQRCEVRQHKTKPWLPMVSFKLFFASAYPREEDTFVMLDAVLEEAPYPGLRKRVRCGELYRSDQTVELPTISGLLADKLLCIGPATLGIPLGKRKEAQRIKHVFDVAHLSRQPYQLPLVREALLPCMEQENRIQRSSWSLAEVIADTRRFLTAAEPFDQPPPAAELEAGTYLDEVARGYTGFREHLFREPYSWDGFRADAARILELLDEIERA